MTKKYLLTLIAALTLTVGSVEAKKQPVDKIYMFGLAASFTDTIVHFTAIQEVDSAWIESRNGFLLERQVYSYQLRDYLDQQLNLPHRTCQVFYNVKREKLEKKLQKMLKLYGKGKDGKQHFVLQHLDPSQFQFRTVSAAEPETE